MNKHANIPTYKHIHTQANNGALSGGARVMKRPQTAEVQRSKTYPNLKICVRVVGEWTNRRQSTEVLHLKLKLVHKSSKAQKPLMGRRNGVSL